MKKTIKWLAGTGILLLFLFLCSVCFVKKNRTEKTQATALHLVLYGEAAGRKQAFFEKEFPEKIKKDLNIDLSVEFVSWESEKKLAARMASGEGFACMNIISQNDWISRGYLASVSEEEIKKACPNLIKARGENGFTCVSDQGKVYAIPLGGKSYAGDRQYFDIRADIVEEAGYQAEEIRTLAQLEEVMASCHALYPNLRIFSHADDFLMSALSGEISDRLFLPFSEHNFVVTDELEKGDTLYSYYETEEFRKLCKITEKWAKLGYIQEDELTSPNLVDNDWNEGNCLIRTGVTGAMVSGALRGKVPQAREVLVKTGNMQDYKFKDYDWAISISKADQDKVKDWLKVFEWIYASQENYDFCVYGEEGKDWKRQDGRIQKLSENTFLDEWLISSFRYKQYDETVSEADIQRYENFDKGSKFSKTSGFVFDSSPVATELAELNEIYEEKLRPMILGLIDYDLYYEETQKEMKEAGLDRYVKEYQKQYSLWYSLQNEDR